VLILALPSTRAMARQLWQRYVIHRIEFVEILARSLPLGADTLRGQLTIPCRIPQDVAGIDEAIRRAGFVPRFRRRRCRRDDVA